MNSVANYYKRFQTFNRTDLSDQLKSDKILDPSVSVLNETFGLEVWAVCALETSISEIP